MQTATIGAPPDKDGERAERPRRRWPGRVALAVVLVVGSFGGYAGFFLSKL